MYYTLCMSVIRRKARDKSTARRLRSVRLEPELLERLRAFSAESGVAESQVIRDALRRHLQAEAPDRLDVRLSKYVGAFDSGGGDSTNSGAQFKRLLAEKHPRRR